MSPLNNLQGDITRTTPPGAGLRRTARRTPGASHRPPRPTGRRGAAVARPTNRSGVVPQPAGCRNDVAVQAATVTAPPGPGSTAARHPADPPSHARPSRNPPLAPDETALDVEDVQAALAVVVDQQGHDPAAPAVDRHVEAGEDGAGAVAGGDDGGQALLAPDDPALRAVVDEDPLRPGVEEALVGRPVPGVLRGEEALQEPFEPTARIRRRGSHGTHPTATGARALRQ